MTWASKKYEPNELQGYKKDLMGVISTPCPEQKNTKSNFIFWPLHSR